MLTETLRRTTYVQGGTKIEQEHTFTHAPMETDDGPKCAHCRMVTNGDLYLVSWPCPAARCVELQENLERVRAHLQYVVVNRNETGNAQ